MKPLFLTKCTMALMIAAIAGGAYAKKTNDENYILNEDFEEISDKYIENSNYHDWQIEKAKYCFFKCLRLEHNYDNDKDIPGYAITPPLGYSGDVLLLFKWAVATSNDIKFSVSIQGDGVFEDGTKTKTYSKEKNYKGTFYPESLKINKVGANTTIKYSHDISILNSFDIDDVKIIKLGEVTLDEAFNPAEAIAANATTPVTVNTNRTLSAGIWNTLCLPFDVTKSQLETAFDKSVELRTFSSYSAADKVMNFIEANSIEAGTPFLVKPAADVTNPSFANVTLSTAEAKTVTNDGVSFVGTYGPTTLATDGRELFITKKNNLARPSNSEAATLPGLRAYITVPENFNGARLMIAGEATGVSSVAADEPTTAPIYNLQGQRLRQLSKGVNIVDGKLIMK